MSNLSNANTASSTQITEKQIRGFLKVFAFYVTLFTFWVWLFITNEGPGGVEFQHLIMMGIVHAVLVFFHALAIFKPEQNTG